MRRCKSFILSVLFIAAWVVLRVSDPLKVSSTVGCHKSWNATSGASI